MNGAASAGLHFNVLGGLNVLLRLGGQMVLNFTFKNDSDFPLNGTQAVFTLPPGVSFASAVDGFATVQGQDVVVTLGQCPRPVLRPRNGVSTSSKARWPATFRSTS